mmetsp:Transcript_176092/g.564642  ORF Transcript_176092/g.564642 Transcript_176092/m.564642 type:complete len:613 (+) Transcript_176092:59-1897(+)
MGGCGCISISQIDEVIVPVAPQGRMKPGDPGVASDVVKPLPPVPLSVLHAMVGASLSTAPWAEEDNSTEWINETIERMWPYVQDATASLVKEQFEPAIIDALPGFLASHVHIDCLHLGNTPPTINAIKCIEGDRGQGLKIRCHICLDSGVDFSAHIGIIPVGISHVKIFGNMSIELALLGELPIVGAIKICFLDPPQIQYEFHGLLKVIEAPGIKQAIRGAVDAILAHQLVMPNSIVVPLVKDIEHLHDQEKHPLGILRVHARSAKDLHDSDFNLLPTKRADPYLCVKLCDQSWTSASCKGTCDPKWADHEFYDFVIYDADQAVSIEVFDDDWGNPDDFLGCICPLGVNEALKASGQDLPLYSSAYLIGDRGVTTGHSEGRLQVGFEWLAMHGLAESEGAEELAGLLLTAAVEEVTMPARLARSICARLRLGDRTVSSRFLFTPRGQLQQQALEADQELVSVVHKGGQMGLSLEELVKLTGLDREMVGCILQGDGKLPEGTFKEERLVTTLRFDSRLHLPIRAPVLDKDAAAHQFESLLEGIHKDVVLELVSLSNTVLSKTSVPLQAIGRGHWPSREHETTKLVLELKGDHGVEVLMTVRLSLTATVAQTAP